MFVSVNLVTILFLLNMYVEFSLFGTLNVFRLAYLKLGLRKERAKKMAFRDKLPFY